MFQISLEIKQLKIQLQIRNSIYINRIICIKDIIYNPRFIINELPLVLVFSHSKSLNNRTVKQQRRYSNKSIWNSSAE